MSLDKEHTTAPEGKVIFGELAALVVDAIAIAIVNAANVDTHIVGLASGFRGFHAHRSWFCLIGTAARPASASSMRGCK